MCESVLPQAALPQASGSGQRPRTELQEASCSIRGRERRCRKQLVRPRAADSASERNFPSASAGRRARKGLGTSAEGSRATVRQGARSGRLVSPEPVPRRGKISRTGRGTVHDPGRRSELGARCAWSRLRAQAADRSHGANRREELELESTHRGGAGASLPPSLLEVRSSCMQ